MHYKAPDNSLHVIDPEFAHLLPIGCVPITEAEADAIRAAQPAPPAPPKQFTSLAFLDLFTEAEQLAVATAAMQSAQVKLWYDRTLAAMFITLSDPRTEAGLDALVGAGLLTAERKAAIVEAMQ